MGFSAGSELQDCPKFPHGSSAMHAAGRRSDRGKIQVDRVETNNRRMSTAARACAAASPLQAWAVPCDGCLRLPRSFSAQIQHPLIWWVPTGSDPIACIGWSSSWIGC